MIQAHYPEFFLSSPHPNQIAQSAQIAQIAQSSQIAQIAQLAQIVQIAQSVVFLCCSDCQKDPQANRSHAEPILTAMDCEETASAMLMIKRIERSSMMS